MKERKSAKSKLQQQQNGHVSPFKFAKLLDPEASWDKDQLGDALHWIRQVAGLVCGLLWGAIPVVGGIWIIVFLVLSSAIIYGYYAVILKIDEEDFGGHAALLQEGLFASFSLFLNPKGNDQHMEHQQSELIAALQESRLFQSYEILENVNAILPSVPDRLKRHRTNYFIAFEDILSLAWILVYSLVHF